MQFTTMDLGFAIRDFIEGQTFEYFNDASELMEGVERIEVVDCSDANNLRVTLANGQAFTVRIIAD